MFVQEIKHKKKGSNTNYQNSSAISESESGSKNPFPTSFISSLLVANFFTHQTQSLHKLAEDETQNQKRKTKEKKMEFNSAFFVFRRVSDFEVNGTRQNDQKWRSYDGSPSARLRNCSKSIILLLGIHPVGNWKLVGYNFENSERCCWNGGGKIGGIAIFSSWLVIGREQYWWIGKACTTPEMRKCSNLQRPVFKCQNNNNQDKKQNKAITNIRMFCIFCYRGWLRPPTKTREGFCDGFKWKIWGCFVVVIFFSSPDTQCQFASVPSTMNSWT